MKLAYQQVRHELLHSFTLSYGTFDYRDAMVVSLSQDGQTGYGEMTVITYYQKSIEKFTQVLSEYKQEIEHFEGDTPEEFNTFLQDLGIEDSFVLSALDNAYWDLYGKIKNALVVSLVELDKNHLPQSSYTVSKAMVAQELPMNWPYLKLKMGYEGDMEVYKSLRAKYKGPISIDANSGWTKEEWTKKVAIIDQFETLETLKYIEQPTTSVNMKNCLDIVADSPYPIIADESFQDKSDLKFCLDHFDGLNIKMMKCGGFSNALKLAKGIKQHGKIVMGGCMTSSTIGIAGLVHLSPMLDYLDADGPVLIKNDLVKQPLVVDGQLSIPNDRCGFGFDVVDNIINI